MTTEATTPAPPRPLGWNLRHSAWLLAVILGVGSISFVGFVYCAFRVQRAAWWIQAGVVTALSLIAITLLAIDSPAAAGFAACLWIALIAYGLFVDTKYLAWRSVQEPPPVTEQPNSVPADAAQPLTESNGPPPLPLASRERPEHAIATNEADDEQAELSDEDRAALDRAISAIDDLRALLRTASGQALAALDEPEDLRQPTTIDSWQEAEELARWHMRLLGFGGAEVTPPGSDGGIDVRSEHAVAQVKHYSAPIGGPVIQQLRGAAHGHDVALFYALSGYTRAALEYADRADVGLFEYDLAARVTPVNDYARILQERASREGTFDPRGFDAYRQAQAAAQKYFDLVTARFFATVRAAEASRRRPSSRFARYLESESAIVSQQIARIGNRGAMPFPELKSALEPVMEATERVRARMRV